MEEVICPYCEHLLKAERPLEGVSKLFYCEKCGNKMLLDIEFGSLQAIF